VQNQWPESTAPAHFATCTAPRWQVAAPRSMVEYEAFHKWRYPNSWMVFVRENPSMALFQDTFIFTYITLIIWHSPPETTWDSNLLSTPFCWVLFGPQCIQPPVETMGCLKIWNPMEPWLILMFMFYFFLGVLSMFWDMLRQINGNIYICYIYNIITGIYPTNRILNHTIYRNVILLCIYIIYNPYINMPLPTSFVWVLVFFEPVIQPMFNLYESQSNHHLPQHETSS
jgi:hypothetical protein